MAFHCELTDLDIHVINTWTYANSAARDAATGFTSDDVYKLAVQTDNNSVWMLVDESPITWQAQGAAVASEISHCDLDNLLVDCHTQYSPLDGSRAYTQPVCGAPPTIGAHLATKAYVDGEIVTDHGDLNGLLDVEDHPDYSTLDGARAYTAPVSGEDPTLDNHLATKNYVDNSFVKAYGTLARYDTQSLSANDVYEDVILDGFSTYQAPLKNISTLPSSAGVEIDIDGIYAIGFSVSFEYVNAPSTTIQYSARTTINGIPSNISDIHAWTRYANTLVTMTFPTIITSFDVGTEIKVQAKTDNNNALITHASFTLSRIDN